MTNSVGKLLLIKKKGQFYILNWNKTECLTLTKGGRREKGVEEKVLIEKSCGREDNLLHLKCVSMCFVLSLL